MQTDIINICRAYLREHGKTAGFTLAQFNRILDEDSEVPHAEAEDMVQAVWDAIH